MKSSLTNSSFVAMNFTISSNSLIIDNLSTSYDILLQNSNCISVVYNPTIPTKVIMVRVTTKEGNN